jgi:hypothetical protein
MFGHAAPCDLFNARGILLVRTGSPVTLRANEASAARVFCRADQAAKISDIDPIAQLEMIGRTLARIGARLASGEAVFRSELVTLARRLHEMWSLDADACLGYARLRTGRSPAVDHVVHVALLVAELAAAQKLGDEQAICAIGGALTMNASSLRLHDEMYARSAPPNEAQHSEIRAHPGASVRLLTAVGRFEKAWLAAVAAHHENIDGSGYPLAITGSEIPLTARILRVADVFAARLGRRHARQAKHWSLRRTQGKPNYVQHVFGSDETRLDPTLMTQLVGRLGRFPPGSLVRLSNGELAACTRRGPGLSGDRDAAAPREAWTIKNARGELLAAPRERPLGPRECQVRHYADDEASALAAYDWRQLWGYACAES